MTESRDETFMRQAISLAKRGLYTTTPNPRVGCVLVKEGRVVGEGFHERAGDKHAEIDALNHAGREAKGASAYVTLEPCNHQGRTGACSEALIAAGVSEVIFGMEDPNPLVAGSGLRRLAEAGIKVRGPVCESECRALNPGFIKLMEKGLPWVRCKMAMSLDGRTAMANGESQWITGDAARDDVQHWRAQSCAIVTGVGTIKADNPSMNVRAERFGVEPRQPLRVVVDSHLRMDPAAQLFKTPGRCAIATCALKRPWDWPAEIWGMPSQGGRVDLHALLTKLAKELCNEVMVEAGAQLAGAFVQQGLVDELIVYMAPKLMGSEARPLFNLPLEAMSQALNVQVQSVTPLGNDWCFVASVNK